MVVLMVAFFGGYYNGGSYGTGNSGGSYGSGSSSSGSSGSSGAGSSGGGGSAGPSLALIQIGDFFTNAWNWFLDLFDDCNCPNRLANNDSEQNLTAIRGGVVLEIKDSPIDCGEGGYVFIIPQDAYVVKILEFENYFYFLHNNDKVFLYYNHHIVDELDAIIQANSNNANLMTILPELINKTRKGEITWEFAEELIGHLIINNNIENIISLMKFLIYMTQKQQVIIMH